MIHCSKNESAELVIVTRDSDYGAHFDNKVYVNDHLKQEFAERVSQKRKLLLYAKLSHALKHFAVPVTKKEEEAEAEIIVESVSSPRTIAPPESSGEDVFKLLRVLEVMRTPARPLPPADAG